jgi:O-antigen/teichoic acid export membrane protein
MENSNKMLFFPFLNKVMEEKNTDGYSHVLKYTGIFGGVQSLVILIGLVRNKVVASLLGPAGMGLAALFNSVVNFISQATNLGISFSAVRHVS